MIETIGVEAGVTSDSMNRRQWSRLASLAEPHHAVQALRTSLLDQAEPTGHVTLQHERAKVARPRDGRAREKP